MRARALLCLLAALLVQRRGGASQASSSVAHMRRVRPSDGALGRRLDDQRLASAPTARAHAALLERSLTAAVPRALADVRPRALDARGGALLRVLGGAAGGGARCLFAFGPRAHLGGASPAGEAGGAALSTAAVWYAPLRAHFCRAPALPPGSPARAAAEAAAAAGAGAGAGAGALPCTFMLVRGPGSGGSSDEDAPLHERAQFPVPLFFYDVPGGGGDASVAGLGASTLTSVSPSRVALSGGGRVTLHGRFPAGAELACEWGGTGGLRTPAAAAPAAQVLLESGRTAAPPRGAWPDIHSVAWAAVDAQGGADGDVLLESADANADYNIRRTRALPAVAAEQRRRAHARAAEERAIWRELGVDDMPDPVLIEAASDPSVLN